jgi:hypothetical protein
MFGLRYTTMNGDHGDPRDYETLEEAMREAVKAFDRPEHGGMVSALAVQIYEHPRPVLRMVVSRQESGTHVQLLVDAAALPEGEG